MASSGSCTSLPEALVPVLRNRDIRQRGLDPRVHRYACNLPFARGHRSRRDHPTGPQRLRDGHELAVIRHAAEATSTAGPGVLRHRDVALGRVCPTDQVHEAPQDRPQSLHFDARIRTPRYMRYMRCDGGIHH